MKARIKSNGKIVEVISRFMPRKRNAASRDWVCNLSDGTCIDESQLEYIEESIDGLDEAAKEYAKAYTDNDNGNGGDDWEDDIRITFIAGAKWDREQMMKEAVEGKVYKFGEVTYVKERNNAELTKYLSQFNNGDKVKIIIVKEDEK